MGQPLRVNIPGLRALGGEVVGHGAALKRDVTAVVGQLAPGPGPGVAGWAAFAALGKAAAGWNDFLTGLGSRMEDTGGKIIDAANQYQATDERAGQRNQVRPR
ncbi:hypothetical protein GCM10027280_60020 [Micromonospora polyrhachis]|uniref:Excreted virulence factor EspC (Type VII ESX diderm) n=1 Tax=Micromonospora polyrhachis TaxID=1282883 RepID=A0A7W7SNA9_9ACTN|nr:hypothetical protein [Micromonospora polyrhachis]MBB4957898.1 hypothetical protein [Micromonospora polyrhachis]